MKNLLKVINTIPNSFCQWISLIYYINGNFNKAYKTLYFIYNNKYSLDRDKNLMMVNLISICLMIGEYKLAKKYLDEIEIKHFNYKVLDEYYRLELHYNYILGNNNLEMYYDNIKDKDRKDNLMMAIYYINKGEMKRSKYFFNIHDRVNSLLLGFDIGFHNILYEKSLENYLLGTYFFLLGDNKRSYQYLELVKPRYKNLYEESIILKNKIKNE